MSQPTARDGKHFRTCPLCEATCGLELHVEAGRVTRIRGDEQDVFSRGFVCPKGASLKDLHEDPDRLRTPLLREGDEWREAGWDEAFAAVEAGLDRVVEAHGRDAIGVYLGNPNAHNFESAFYARPLLKALGTRHIYSASTVDQMPRHVSSGLLYGSPGTIPVPDLDRTRYLLMLGANPYESNGSLCTAPDFPGRLKQLRARGGKLVVVDPRTTRTARVADEHLAIRPGTDVFFLLALAQQLFEAGPELGPAGEHVEGLSSVREAVQGFTPETVAARTGIPAEATRRIARELAEAEGAAVYGRIGSNTVRFGTLSSWATDLVTLLAGDFDRPGGMMFPSAAHARADAGEPGGRGFITGRWKSRVRGLPEVLGELPVAALAEEIETPGEGQLRGLLTIAGNPVVSTPNGGRLDRALAGLGFMVSVDIYLNETTRHADVILPPPSPLERSHYDFAFFGLSVRNVVNYSPPIFARQGPSESEILARLALIAQGKGAGADPALVDQLLISGAAAAAVSNEAAATHGADPEALAAESEGREGPERIVDLLLRAGPYGDRLSLAELEANPHGIDLGPLEPRLPGVLRTPSGRLELWTPVIADELLRAGELLAAPEPDGLVLVGRRHVRSNNSWLHNVERLVRGRERCTLQMHPEDAARAGLADGARARVRSRVGQLEAPVEVTEDVRPGVVSLPHGWGHDAPGARLAVAARHAGVNSNLLTDESQLDRPSGTAVLNGIPVEVEALGRRVVSGPAILDCDGHVMEPPDAWERHLAPEYRALAPRQLFDDQGRFRHIVGGELKPPIPAPDSGWEIPAGAHDAKQRLADMDGQGIDASLLFPTLGLMFAGLSDTAVQVALCGAYNDWLHEFCAADRRRLLGVALLPQRDVPAALGEARRAVSELGFRVVMLRPNPVLGRSLGHPCWEPLWSLLEELGVPLAVHEGTTQDLPQSGRDRYENFVMRHMCSHPHEQQMACMELIVGGVLERHPGLRALFLESGCGWAPHWLERMDEHMESWPWATAPLPHTPTEYFQRQCFVAAEPGEKSLAATVSLLGDGCVVFGSDYPHPDALSGDVVGRIRGVPEFGDETLDRILGANARRYLGLA